MSPTSSNLFHFGDAKPVAPLMGEYHRMPTSSFLFLSFVRGILTTREEWGGRVSVALTWGALWQGPWAFRKRDSGMGWILFHGMREVHYQGIVLVMLCAFCILPSAFQKREALLPGVVTLGESWRAQTPSDLFLKHQRKHRRRICCLLINI